MNIDRQAVHDKARQKERVCNEDLLEVRNHSVARVYAIDSVLGLGVLRAFLHKERQDRPHHICSLQPLAGGSDTYLH